jgi:hypothetical protein
MWDCRFAKINRGGNVLGVEISRGVGYYFFEDRNGDCLWLDDELEEETIGDIVEFYINDFLGASWNVGRGFGMAASICGFLLWIWSLIFACTAHPKPFRYLLAFLLLLMTIFQGLAFLPLNSSFCNTWNCKFSRGAGLSVGALICFFLSIIPCFLMKDFPGDRGDEREPASMTTSVAVATGKIYEPRNEEEAATSAADAEQGESTGVENKDDAGVPVEKVVIE